MEHSVSGDQEQTALAIADDGLELETRGALPVELRNPAARAEAGHEAGAGASREPEPARLVDVQMVRVVEGRAFAARNHDRGPAVGRDAPGRSIFGVHRPESTLAVHRETVPVMGRSGVREKDEKHGCGAGGSHAMSPRGFHDVIR